MNSINFLLNAAELKVESPLLLLLLIPGVILALFPYFRLKKEKRRTRERIMSMVLHMLVLLLSVFVLAGFTVHEEDALIKNETVIIIDVSDSLYKEQKDNVNNYINDVMKDADLSNTIGIVAFGDGAIWYEPLKTGTRFNVDSFTSKATKYNDDEKNRFQADGTNLAKAIKYAGSQCKNASTSRLILVTDGLQTDGDAESVVRQLTAQNVRIDVVYFAPTVYENEMQISDIEMKHAVLDGEEVGIEVTIQSHVAGTATLTASDLVGTKQEGTSFAPITVEVPVGESTHVISAKFSKMVNGTAYSLHTVKVELTREGDELEDNNKFFSYVTITDTNSVLIIYGQGQDTGATEMENILKANGYEVTKTPEASAPDVLSKFGEIILMNVNSSNLPGGSSNYGRDYATKIRNFVAAGGGLLTTGGEQTYFNGSMKNNDFNAILPVDVEPEPSGAKAVYFVVDNSSGMFGHGVPALGGGYNYRIDAVKAALKYTLADDVFHDGDQFGLIGFGGKAAPVKHLPICDASTNLGKMYTAINSMERMSFTEWSVPLEMAYTDLKLMGDDYKRYVIFITDGTDNSRISGRPNGYWNDANNPNNVGRALAAGIKTIPLGINTAGNTTEIATLQTNLSAMAASAGTEYTLSYDPTGIINSISDAVKSIKTDIVTEEGAYQPKIGAVTAAVRGISNEQLPTVSRYNGSTIRPDAASVLEYANEGTMDPIYAQWSYGKGKVGSFMSDVGSSGTWGGGYITSATGKTLFTNVTNLLFSSAVSADGADLNITYTFDNFTTKALIAGSGDAETMKARITSPSGDISEVTMNLAAESFSGLFATREEGLYSVEYSKYDKDGNAVGDAVAGYFTFAYSEEYNTFYDVDDAERFAYSLTGANKDEAKQGIVFTPDEEVKIFDSEFTRTVTDTPLQDIFMIAALILFVLDIVVRKFHVPLPNEWFKKKTA